MKTSQYGNTTTERRFAKRAHRSPEYQKIRERARASEAQALADRKARKDAEKTLKEVEEKAAKLVNSLETFAAKMKELAENGASGNVGEILKFHGLL